MAAAAGQVSAFLAARQHARAKDRHFLQFGQALSEAAREIAALAAAQSDAAREARADADKAAQAAARAGSALADAEARFGRFVQRAEQSLHSATETMSAAAAAFEPLESLARNLPQSVESAVAGASRAAAQEAASHFAAAEAAHKGAVNAGAANADAVAADTANRVLMRAEDALAAIEAAAGNAGRLDAPIERLEAAAARWEAGAAEIAALRDVPTDSDTRNSDTRDSDTLDSEAVDAGALAAAAVAATDAMHHAAIMLDAQAIAATRYEPVFAALLSRLESLAAATDATLIAANSGAHSGVPNHADLVQATARATASLDRASAVIAPLSDAWPALARAALNGAETLRRQSDAADRIAGECQHTTARLFEACAQVASAGTVLPAVTAALSAAIEAPAFRAMSGRDSELLHALEDSAAQITSAASRACESATAISEQLPARIELALAPSIGTAASLADRLSLTLERASQSVAPPPVDWVQAADTFAARSAETLAAIAKSIVCVTETRLESAVDQALARLPMLETMIEDRLGAGSNLGAYQSAASEMAASQMAASGMAALGMMEHAASELRADCADALAAARRMMTATADTMASQADIAAQITAALAATETASRAGPPLAAPPLAAPLANPLANPLAKPVESPAQIWPQAAAAWAAALQDAMQPVGAALERVLATGEAQNRASARVMDAIRQVESALTASQPSSIRLNPRRSATDTVALVRQVAEAAKALQGETEIMALAAHGGRRDLAAGDVSAVPAMLQEVGGAISQLQDAATALALVCDMSAAA
jgi:hypothetical protein